MSAKPTPPLWKRVLAWTFLLSVMEGFIYLVVDSHNSPLGRGVVENIKDMLKVDGLLVGIVLFLLVFVWSAVTLDLEEGGGGGM